MSSVVSSTTHLLCGIQCQDLLEHQCKKKKIIKKILAIQKERRLNGNLTKKTTDIFRIDIFSLKTPNNKCFLKKKTSLGDIFSFKIPINKCFKKKMKDSHFKYFPQHQTRCFRPNDCSNISPRKMCPLPLAATPAPKTPLSTGKVVKLKMAEHWQRLLSWPALLGRSIQSANIPWVPGTRGTAKRIFPF